MPQTLSVSVALVDRSAGAVEDHWGAMPPGAQDADHSFGRCGLLEAGEALDEFALSSPSRMLLTSMPLATE